MLLLIQSINKTTTTTTTCRLLFQGQGQECLLEKSMQDNRKNSIIAKICQQVWSFCIYLHFLPSHYLL